MIKDCLETNSLFLDVQYGFKSGIFTNQLLPVNDEAKWFDAGFSVDVLFDFYKAFNYVCQQILLDKLNSTGITDKIFGLDEGLSNSIVPVSHIC